VFIEFIPKQCKKHPFFVNNYAKGTLTMQATNIGLVDSIEIHLYIEIKNVFFL
jgi:hypothetical protein